MNVLSAPGLAKQPPIVPRAPRALSPALLRKKCTPGGKRRATCRSNRPVCSTIRAVTVLRVQLPDLRVLVVNVVALMVPQPQTKHPHGLQDAQFDALFTLNTPVTFAFHAYPALIHQLVYRRHNLVNIYVRGYYEGGTTTTPFDMVVFEQADRYQWALDVIRRVPHLQNQMEAAAAYYCATIERHRQHIDDFGDDLPEVRDWRWCAP
jgi:xylulose-5-phosphate/fructose-6-phosphate phosphoketolase